MHGLIDGDPAGVLGRPLAVRPRGFGAPAPASVHKRDEDRASSRPERHRRPERGVLERWSVVDQKGLQGLAEVLDEMEPIDHLHGIGRAPANAIRIQVAPITADHRNRRMLGEPCRDAGGRAVRQQVDDTMCRQIDEDGAIAMTSPPGPLVYPNDLEGWGVGHQGCPHQPE
jgi:hypothetical protein